MLFRSISDRPEVLLVDDQNRPHCDTGPFCRWRDGTALYAVHGTRVPAWIIEQPGRLTVASIDAETNAEVRRVMVERYGYGRYLVDSGARVTHECVDEVGVPMRLLRRDQKGDEPIVCVELLNTTPDPDGTRRLYHVRVPPTVEDCWTARNWICGIDHDARIGVQT